MASFPSGATTSPPRVPHSIGRSVTNSYHPPDAPALHSGTLTRGCDKVIFRSTLRFAEWRPLRQFLAESLRVSDDPWWNWQHHAL
jgi:hypothetical protein